MDNSVSANISSLSLSPQILKSLVSFGFKTDAFMSSYKFKHFYFNKYFLSLFKKKSYHLSYDYEHKAIWFRTYKVASRTIDNGLKQGSPEGKYIYGSEMSYSPRMARKYFKFAFVRNPEERFLSGWRDKVVKQNYYNFDQPTHEKMKNIGDFLTWVETLNLDKCDEHLRRQSALIDLNNIDFIGRFEYFNRDFAYLSEKLGLNSKSPEHLNISPKKEVDLTIEQRMRIYQLYKKDFDIFYPDHLSQIQQ